MHGITGAGKAGRLCPRWVPQGLRPQGHPGVLQQHEVWDSPSTGLFPPQEGLLAGR